ncbi:energy-coupling factor ABC transporter substrate-binding protein [Actinomycetota bacterium]|nr:energy-coupling factor ABC transporter substrate-binding protein [Micrococcales bacterium]
MRRPLSRILLGLLAVMLVVVAYAVGSARGDGEFGGTDAAATELVEGANPDYEPWFQPLFSPGGGEVESGLFALQAAIGGGVLGFVLGTLRERRRRGGDEA